MATTSAPAARAMDAVASPRPSVEDDHAPDLARRNQRHQRGKGGADLVLLVERAR